jgi:AcrR family transcriptional regulator
MPRRAQEPGIEPAAVYDPASLPEHQRRRRQRMIQAAIELLEAGDYDTVQIRDVAEKADVAVGTVYRYFTSKEHLYAAVLVEWSSGIVPRLLRPGDDLDTDERRLRRMLMRTVKSFEKWPQMMRAEMVLESSSDPNAKVLLDDFSRQYSSAMQTVLRDMTPATAAAVAHVVNSVVYRGLRSWALGRCSLADVDREAQRAVDLIFSGPPT